MSNQDKMNERLRELREAMRPVLDAARRAFGSEDGKKVLAALDRAYGPESMVAHDGNGAVDPNAILINVGRVEVINYLRKLAEPNEGQG